GLMSGGKTESNPASGSVLDTASASPRTSPTPTVAPSLVPAKEADITGKEVIQMDGQVIVGNSGYEYYKFDQQQADNYAAAINKSTSLLPAGTTVYDLIIPGAVDVMLPLSFLNENADKTSDQGKAIQYVSKKLETSVRTVLIYDLLKAHCNEALYFSADNHWTSLAAYYAYTQWASVKGIAPAALNAYEEAKVEGFSGNMYTATAHEALPSTETITLYKPKSPLSLSYGDTATDLADGAVFADVADAGAMDKFKVFLGGMHNYSKITNTGKNDNSACIIVADTNGAVLAPYIAENYQFTHVIDYRNYQGSLSALVTDTHATDVIYCTSIVATCAGSLVEGLQTLAK
ncbi:MAG: DHHW family protein, partial [Oscillospiraceae bacterium]